jgi:predicted 2-oxoglutarate/Fe(II)-dependent dioxygenase YbiX
VTLVRDRVVAAMARFFGVHAWPDLTLLSEMRIGDCHPLHADAELQTADGWVPNHTSWRSHVGLLYLNSIGDDYRGGMLHLPTIGLTIEPLCGLLVAFPSGSRFVHEVTKVEAGRRMSMAIWLTTESAHGTLDGPT